MCIIPVLPIASVFLAFVIGLISKLFVNCQKLKNLVIILACSLVGVALLISIYNFFIPEQVVKIASFLPVLNSNWTISLQKISNLMVSIVTLVSCLVHIFSIEYMREDPRKDSFFCFLSFFTFFMLLLVLSDNFAQLFVGWEGVGLCSYLLIGFFRHKESANAAAMKAFLTNRVGDAGLLIAMAILYVNFGSLNFADIFPNLDIIAKATDFLGLNWQIIDFVCLFLFVGCMGKSAQILLHVWLPDAMEGPTPVSALIHAATMVTAGVFLLILCHDMIALSTIAQNFIMIIGAITIVFAGSVAIFQNDIKKIIAYSTCSQLGYMIAGCGALIFEGSMFHLATHAFFKALLFLGAGVLIHQNHHQQDIYQFPKNLYQKMPYSMLFMLIGTLAITGIPPFAGFFSKDLLIEGIFVRVEGNLYAEFSFFCAIFGVILTSIYSWRLFFVTFFNKNGSSESPAEPSWTMQTPVLILTIGAVFSGLWGIHFFHITAEGSFLNFLTDADFLHKIHDVPQFVKLAPLLISVFGMTLSYFVFCKRNMQFNTQSGMAKIATNKFYFDELYQKIILSPVKCLAQKGVLQYSENALGRCGDRAITEKIMQISATISSWQNGRIALYAIFILFTMLVLMAVLLI